MEINKDKKVIIMNNGNRLEIKYKSELLDQIREDLIAIESESSDSSQESFTEDDVWSLYEFLLIRHKDDWIVIDDMEDEEAEDSYYEEKEEYYYEEEHTVDDENDGVTDL
mgnify:CR=1 FL=1